MTFFLSDLQSLEDADHSRDFQCEDERGQDDFENDEVYDAHALSFC